MILSVFDREESGTAYGETLARLDSWLALLRDDAIDAPPVLDGLGSCRALGVDVTRWTSPPDLLDICLSPGTAEVAVAGWLMLVRGDAFIDRAVLYGDGVVDVILDN